MVFPRKSKYGAKKTERNGILFDSKKEAERYEALSLMEKAGRIENLRLQVPFELIPKHTVRKGKTFRAVTYVADFVYIEDGQEVVEDVKGFVTPEYKLKEKMMYDKYGIEIKRS